MSKKPTRKPRKRKFTRCKSHKLSIYMLKQPRKVPRLFGAAIMQTVFKP